jgi:hypothetical protein
MKRQLFDSIETHIANNTSVHQKHPAVPDSSECSDGTWYALMEKYTLPVAQATPHIAYVPLSLPARIRTVRMTYVSHSSQGLQLC